MKGAPPFKYFKTWQQRNVIEMKNNLRKTTTRNQFYLNEEKKLIQIYMKNRNEYLCV